MDHLHIAGGWGMSSARTAGDGTKHPIVYLKLVAGVVGTGPRYHVLHAIVDADVALELSKVLAMAAERGRLDVESTEGGS